MVSLTLTTALMCTSCMVGPNYTPPCIPEEKWATKEDDASPGEPIDIAWWTVFDDPLLSALIEDVAYGNFTIQEARERVCEARALRAIAFAPLLPWVGANGSYTNSQVSLNGPNGEGFFVASGIARRQNEIYEANFDALWELDVFGGQRRAFEAATDRVGAAVASRRDVLLSVIAETARNYFELRGFQKRLSLLRKNARLQENTLNLVQKKYDIGLAREVDITRAKALLENTRAQIPDLKGRVQTASYRIAVLTGRMPGALYECLKEERSFNIPEQIVPIGLRSEILRRRPDVQLAERKLASSTAEIGVAVAKLYPSFTLTGNYGVLSANTIRQLFNERSETWLLNGLVHIPIFEGGRLVANVKLNESIQMQALFRYQDIVLQALEDAESSLVRYSREQETLALRKAEVRAADQSTLLLRHLYENGLTDFLDVLVAEREQTSAEDNLALSETKVLTNLVSLYKSLGGGWEVFDCLPDCDH